jgi:hypothetical protein
MSFTVWEEVGADNQLGRDFPPLTYTQQDAGLVLLEPAPRTIGGARDLLSVALQYGNAFGQGFQAAALKPADFFGDDDQLYLMEDIATGEILVSILWDWLQKGAKLTEDDPSSLPGKQVRCLIRFPIYPEREKSIHVRRIHPTATLTCVGRNCSHDKEFAKDRI